jgi:hypothetical protein
MKLTAKNWAEFQHYKDRKPPWIRLHRTLLDDKDFHRMPVESRALAPMLWLLASESVDGVIDASLDDLSFRLRCDELAIARALLPLLERGFFQTEHGASDVLALRKRLAVPESEAEAERDSDAEALAETEASQTVAGASRPTRRVEPRPKPQTNPVWEAYAVSYENRYRVAPIRNAKINGQLALLLGRVPVEEAPLIAAFYVTHNGRFYVEKGHAIDYLLRDAEKIRTEFVTRKQFTSAQATLTDRTQTNLGAFGPLIAEARAMEAADGEREAA